LKELRDIASKNHTPEADFQDLIRDAVLELWNSNVSIQIIAKSLKITEERVRQIIENQPKA
jgi:DNA-directed RNA polymerase sigma subunit (sigma70/sigma32)